MAEMTVQTIMALIHPVVSKRLRDQTTKPANLVKRIKSSERKTINAKGYRFRVKLRSNYAHGGIADGGNLIGGSGDRFAELLVGTVNNNGARLIQGGFDRNMKDPSYAGESIADMIMEDARTHWTEVNKNLCYGGVLFSRGIVEGTPIYSAPYSTVTFETAEGGSFYVEPTADYFFHHPTTYALHGGAVRFTCFDKPTKLTARFIGDVTAATTTADADLVVPAGGAATTDSSINRGQRNLAYFCGDSGDYFGADRDVEDRLRGIRYDANGDMITQSLLQYVDTLYEIKWPERSQGTMGHTDVISSSQDAAMLFNAYPLWRLDEQNYRNFDPQTKFKGVGGREKIKEVHIKDNVWYRLMMDCIYHGEQVPWDVYSPDSLTWRTIQANSSILDKRQIHYWSTDQIWCEDPGHQIEISDLGTTAVALKTTS